MSSNIPGLETDNGSEDVDVKHEPLEPDVDYYVSMTGYVRFNLGILWRNSLMAKLKTVFTLIYIVMYRKFQLSEIEYIFVLIIPCVLNLQMSSNIPELKTENDSEDVDVKHEPLEPDVDDYVSMSA